MDLPAVHGAMPSTGLHRGGDGQLSHQAQSILMHLAAVFEHTYLEHARLLGLPAQTRLPGFLAHLTGVGRTVVSKHLPHLLDRTINVPQNRGGRKRTSTEAGLPSELPVLTPAQPLLVPSEEDFQ